MEQEHELSDDACDRLVAATMDKLAQKAGGEFPMHALDLNPDIMAHHTLRRSIVRVAYELGKTVAAVPNACGEPGLTEPCKD